MKTYFKVVMLSLKIYENILKFNFLTGGGGLDILTVYASFLKRLFIDLKNDEGVGIYNHAKIPLKRSIQNDATTGKFTAH